jgi:predicted MFS family arabinose efflux permease
MYATLVCVLNVVQPVAVIVMLHLSLELKLEWASRDNVYALLALVGGIGVIVGSIMGGRVEVLSTRPHGITLLLAVGSALLFVTSMLSPYLLIWTALPLWGIAFGATFSATGGHLAANTPDETRGRIYALINSAVYMASAIGAALACHCADLSSSYAAMMAGGIGVLGALLVFRRARATSRGAAVGQPATQI